MAFERGWGGWWLCVVCFAAKCDVFCVDWELLDWLLGRLQRKGIEFVVCEGKGRRERERSQADVPIDRLIVEVLGLKRCAPEICWKGAVANLLRFLEVEHGTDWGGLHGADVCCV